jgi:uncharacterized protein YndB with AHSA1/START domain
MTNVGTLQVTTPSDREISMTRVFDAPRDFIFDAHTRPELIRRWLGARAGWSMPVCDVDLKVGGSYRYVWAMDDGSMEMGMGGVFLEIARPERLVNTEKFDQSWYEGDAVDTLTLIEKGGKTTLTMTVRYQSQAVRDAVLKSPMKEGMADGYDSLAKLAASMAAAGVK